MTEDEITQLKKPGLLKEEQGVLDLLEKCFIQVEVALQPVHVAGLKDSALRSALKKHQLLCESLESEEDEDGVIKSKVKKSYRTVMKLLQNTPDDFAQIKSGLDGEMGKTGRLFFENFKTVIGCALEGEAQEEVVLNITPFQTLDSEVALDEKIASVTKQISSTDAKIEDCQAIMEKLKILPVSETPLTDEEYQSHLCTPEQLDLQQELNQLKAQLNKLFLENREKEGDIQEGTDVVEGEIEQVIEGFDEKMEEMQADLEAREAELQRYEEELNSLQKLFTNLEGEYNTVVAKRLLAEERMKEEQRIEQLKTRAAIIAQAWWRGFSVRKAMKNKAKKKGKKGKGKKK